MGHSYFTMFEATAMESQGCLYLARAFGAQFLYYAYKVGTYQITGVTNSGDQHAGTGIAISPHGSSNVTFS